MGWIQQIADGIKTVMSKIRTPFPEVPPILLLCEIGRRPGLSAIALASAVISRLGEIGFDTGVNRDGSPNVVNGFVRIFSEELVNEIKNNASVSCAIDVGDIPITGTGGNAGGPVQIQGFNNMISSIKGLVK